MKVFPTWLTFVIPLTLLVTWTSSVEAADKKGDIVDVNCKKIADLRIGGKYSLAEKLANQCIREAPNELRYRHEKIETLHDEAKYADTFKEIDECIKLNPSDYIAYYWRSDIYSHQSKNYEARIAANKCIQINPHYAPGYSLKGNYEYQEGNYKLAISYAKLAIKYDPTKSSCWNSLGLAYMGLDDNQNAVMAFEKALSIDTNETLYLNNLSMALLNCGRKKEAMEKLNLALKLEPKNPFLLQKRACIYQETGKLNEALADISKVIAQHLHTIAQDYITRAGIYIELKRYDEAITDAKTAISLKKKFSNGYYVWARAQFLKGNYKEAIANCDKAIAESKDINQAFKLRGLCYQAIGDDEKALSDFEHYTANYKDPESYKARARISAKQGYFEQAADDLSAIMPFSTNFKSNPKDYNRLLKLYNNIIASRLSGNETYFDRGMVYLAAGEYKNAAADFEHYLKASKGKGKSSLAAAAWAVFSYQKIKQDAPLRPLLNYLKDNEPVINKSPELQFLRKEISVEKFMETSTDARTLSQKGALAGMVLSMDGQNESAASYLSKVKRKGDPHMDEYFVALKELDRIEKMKGPTGAQSSKREDGKQLSR